MPGHYDEETEIWTIYDFYIEDIQVELDDRWCPGATISLYRRNRWVSGGRELLDTKVDCPKELLWTPPAPTYLLDTFDIGYWADGYVHYEMLATEREADEIATRVTYDAQDEAPIEITHTLSIGTSTVWIKVRRHRDYDFIFDVDVRLCVEFANSEQCTRFLHEDMTKLEEQDIHNTDSGVSVIDDIMRALFPLRDDHFSARRNAARRRIPFSQFLDEYPQPETQLIRHRDSNRGHDRLCYLPCTLHLRASTLMESLVRIGSVTVDWGAVNSFPTRPLSSDAFHSLSSLHLNFPSSTHHGYPNHDTPSQSDTDALRFTVEATGIHGLTATNSVAQGNSITIASKHRNVQVNLAGLHGITLNINIISGDGYFGAISGGNVGGRNNVNNIRISTPLGSRSPRLAASLPRRHTSLPSEQAGSQGGVGRWVEPRPSRPTPYSNGSTRARPLDL